MFGIFVMVGGKMERMKKKEYGMLVGDVEKILIVDMLFFKFLFFVDIWFCLFEYFVCCIMYYVIFVIDCVFKIKLKKYKCN